jgi:phosphate starvation-inducible protein PhoH
MSKKKGSKADALVGDNMMPVEPVLQKASFPGVIVSAKNEGQKEAIRTIETHEVSILSGVPGTGKAQPLDSTIYTPNGKMRFGDIRVGDDVCTPDGKTAKVIGIYPQGKKEVYKITFKDGSTVECCLEHLWKIYFKNNKHKSRIVDTKYILENFNRRTISIEATRPVDFAESSVLIPPYLLGLLLGDGGFSNSNITLTTADESIVVGVRSILSEKYQLKIKKNSEIDYRIVKTEKTSSKNEYKDALRIYGLWGLKSNEKHIPHPYLYGSIDQRKDLLRGLMDSDGWVEKNGQVCYCSTSKQLIEDFTELINSLGGRVYLHSSIPSYRYKGEKKYGKLCYTASIVIDNPEDLFTLEREKIRIKPRRKYFSKNIIRSIEKIGEKECQCIMIDSPDHLYLTNHFIPTHNTHLAVGLALKDLFARKYERVILTRPYVEAGEHLGFLPGGYNNKIAPFMYPIVEIMSQYIKSKDLITKLIDNGNISVVPLAYMRGCTFKNSFVVADECQNTTVSQMRMLLTRIGDNSKLVITGDVEQSDIGYKNGLMDAIDRLQDIKEIGFHNMGEECCVRSGIVAKIEMKYRNK